MLGNLKKVLIITYYWIPAGGPGVQRWLMFVKYLRDFGIEPVVYVPENPHYPMTDTAFEKEIPEGITVIKQPIKEPYAFAKLFSRRKTQQISSGVISSKKQSFLEKMMLWVRGNLFIPDARKFWVKPSVKYLEKYLSAEEIDTVITTGPPHSVHLIGLELKKIRDILWIADFRDPWTSIGYHKKLKLTKSSRQKHKQLEKEVLQNADTVLATSPSTKKEFEQLTQKPVVLITNGFDREISKEKQPDEKFTISHIGSLLSERNPLVLWKVLSEISSENPDFANDFRLQLAGTVSDEVLKSIAGFGLEKYLHYAGYVSHNEALQIQQKSQVLLLIEINSEETRAIIPGKLFEYMAANRPILAIAPKGSDIQPLIEETKTGVFLDYAMETELKETILAFYKKYQSKDLRPEATGITQYSRRNLTKKLAEIINQ